MNMSLIILHEDALDPVSTDELKLKAGSTKVLAPGAYLDIQPFTQGACTNSSLCKFHICKFCFSFTLIYTHRVEHELKYIQGVLPGHKNKTFFVNLK